MLRHDDHADREILRDRETLRDTDTDTHFEATAVCEP